MLNVQALQQTLSAMSLPQIQQYAALHKNDPYVVSMALSIANTKKEAMLAQQGAAGQQQMPKVVDQDIAQIAPHQQPAPGMGAATQLPENQGIGQLPAPNMQKMAEGGIVAFADGGDVPRYDGQTNGSYVKYPYGMAGGQPQGLYDIPGMVTGQPFLTANNPDLAQRIAQIEALPDNRFSRATKDQMIADAKTKAGLAATQSPLTTPTTLPGQGSPKLPDTTVIPAAKAQADVDAAAKVDTGKTAPDKKDDSLLPPAPKPMGLPSLDANEKRLAAALNKDVPSKEDFMKEREAIMKPFMDKANEIVQRENDKLSTDREQAIYMSMIKGGFAAAAGKSPYFFTNIAEGGQAGISDFSDAMKEIRKAAKENSKMELELERYRATDSVDALKSYYDAKAKRDDRYAAGLTSLMTQQMQTQGQMAVASMPGAQERLFTSLADPKSAAYKGFKNYAETMGPEAKGDTTLRAAAINKWSSEPMLRQEFNNDFDAYYRMMAGQQATSKATAKQLEYLKLYAPKAG